MKKSALIKDEGKRMKKLIIICVAVTGLILTLGANARAATVNVRLTPKWKNFTGVVDIGQTFDLELWLESPAGESQVTMSDIELLLEWDPAYIGFNGSTSTANGDYDWTTAMSHPDDPTLYIPMYAWEGSAGVNASYADGDAWIQLYPGFAYLHGMPQPQTDLHALTLTFTALALTDSTVIAPSLGTPGDSYYIIEDGSGTHIEGIVTTGTQVSVVPEPGTMMLFLFGSLTTGLFRIRLKRKKGVCR